MFYLCPIEYTNVGTGLGLKATIETIDNRSDFKTYMHNYVYARGSGAPKGPRREGPPEEGFVSSSVCLLLLFNITNIAPATPTTNTQARKTLPIATSINNWARQHYRCHRHRNYNDNRCQQLFSDNSSTSLFPTKRSWR